LKFLQKPALGDIKLPKSHIFAPAREGDSPAAPPTERLVAKIRAKKGSWCHPKVNRAFKKPEIFGSYEKPIKILIFESLYW